MLNFDLYYEQFSLTASGAKSNAKFFFNFIDILDSLLV